MKRLILVIFFGLLMSTVLATGQEAYRWVDEKGTIHFADDLSQIPEKYLDQVQKKKFQQEPSASAPVAPAAPAAGRAAPQSVSKQPAPVSKPGERKDILGRGEDWWRGQVREWNTRLIAAQKSYEAAALELKNKEKELGDARFKSDYLKRKLGAEQTALKEKVAGFKKQMDDAKDMLEKGLPKQAEEYQADPNWLKY
jgi:hypothetical protein